MKKARSRVALAGLFFALTLTVNAQILKEGIAPSIEYSLEDPAKIHDFSPAFDWDALAREDEEAQKQGSPMRAGFAVKVGKGINEFGEWLRLPDGRMLWRVSLRAKGASGLGVVFDQFELPEGSELYLYNEGRTMVNGALGPHNNNPAQVLSTQVLYGSTITIEYVERPSPQPQPEKRENGDSGLRINLTGLENYRSPAILHIGELMFMYRDVYAIFDGSKPATGSSEWCEVDINCAAGANWQDQKRGVVHNLNKIGNSWYYCSGSLVNNTAETFDPYYLTAFHCGEGASAADRLQWQFYFNYERPSCGSGTPITTQVITGCELRAQAPIAGGSDFLLVELITQVPLSYNPFYNGWDRQNIAATSGAGIHHPAGDVKKISTYSATLTSSNPNIDGDVMATNAAWQVVWSANESGWGVTEGGSSGSPLFNQNGLLVGTLTGGSSYCNAQTSPDYYGKFSYHWESNGTADAQRLRPWLDPLGTNPSTLRGWDPQWTIVSVPVSLTASPNGTNQISLSWVKNAEGNDVMLVWSPDNTFGIPADGVAYAPGTPLPGGGTVLYRGPSTTFDHSGLSAATTYYYRAYSYNPAIEYSGPRWAQATTFCLPVDYLPFSEDFNASNELPLCWEIIDNQGNGQVWQFGTHTNGLNGTTGNYAYLNSDAYGSGNTQNADLVTPLLDLSNYTDISLSFSHYFRRWSGSSATLSYSIDDGQSWTQIQQWTSNTANPAAFNQVIAAVAGQSLVRFKWNYTGAWGYYWDVDNIGITGTQVSSDYANFNANKTSAYTYEEIVFTDASSSSATAWNWDFGAGAVPATATGQGPHTVYYTTVGQKTVSLTIDTEAGPFTRTKNNYISITENPFSPPRNLAGVIADYGVGVNLSWLSPLLNEGFEPYANFALDFGNWTQVDVDGSATYAIQDVSFTNQGYTGSFIIFNPSQTTPTLSGEWPAYEGEKYAACFAAVTPPNNDWLISPKIKVSGGESFSFQAKSITDQYGLERFKVGVSTTGTNPADFTIISSGSYVEAPTTWTPYTYDLSAYAGQEVYLAINCVSNDAFALMIDQVMIEDGTKENNIFNIPDTRMGGKNTVLTKVRGTKGPVMGAGADPKSFASYTVYRDDAMIGTTDGFNFSDGPLAPGVYEYAVTANYVNPNYESPPSTLAEVIIDTRGWTGSTSNDWFTPSNWLGNAVPVITENVAVYTPAVDNFPTIDENLTEITGLTLAPEVSLQIAPTGQLTINGTLTNLAGVSGLQIASDATGTGSLIHNTAGVEATVQRYATGGWASWDAGWHIISSPVLNQPIADFTTSGPGNDYDFYGWDEVSNTWINFKENGTDPIQFSTWNGGTSFNPGQGYLISYQNTQTKAFAGTLNVISIFKTGLTQSTGTYSGWHLMGNPFASALQWNDIDENWALNHIAGVAKIWHEGNMSYSDINEGGTIPSAQGFMVQVTDAGGGSLSIPAAARIHSSQDWYKDGGIQKIQLLAREHDNRSAQETNIVVIPETSEAFHSYYDSRFLWGYAPGFYSLKDGQALSTYTLPALNEDLVIPLGFDKNEASQFTITLEESIEGTSLYLFDKKLEVEHPLGFDSPYAFTAQQGDDSQRFELRFSPANTTGLEESLADALGIYIWNNTLYLNFAEEAEGRLLQVFDLSGRLVMSDGLDHGLNHTRPMNLEAGVYLVRISSPKGVSTQRVFVK